MEEKVKISQYLCRSMSYGNIQHRVPKDTSRISYFMGGGDRGRRRQREGLVGELKQTVVVSVLMHTQEYIGI